MTNDEVTYFRQAEQYANSGQRRVAHKMFCQLRDNGNTEIEIFFWIATTSSNPFETKRAIDTIRQLQPTHPRLPALVALCKKQWRYTSGIRLFCLLYLVSIVFIFPIPAMNPSKIIAIIYIVLFHLVLVINIVSLALRRVAFTKLSALYLGALAGFFMAIATGTYVGIPEVVFGVSFSYAMIYTIALAVRGIWTGSV